MKATSLTPDDTLHAGAAQPKQAASGSWPGRLARATRSMLNQIGTAIAIGEAGDLEAAHAWREQHGIN